MRVPVLTYHAVNIAGNDYATNDHVALASDLRTINRLGLRVVPLQWVVEQRLGLTTRDLSACVALSCDDGSDFDFRDLEFREHGLQRSFFNILGDFVSEHGAAEQPHLNMTSFVIASPEARAHIDRGALDGRGWMSEDWWPEAETSGLMTIGNHSWDHNHPAIPAPGVDGMPRGSFLDVDNEKRADAEIADAARYINARIAPRRSRLFCYPFSHIPAFVHDDYLPRRGADIGLLAAFGDGAVPVTMASDIWNLPRYICGWHWRDPQALCGILDASAQA
ncbi:polysaccharide deacetylase family protein [Dokdonella sp.]|uniref:polysaccharide deacetylase family protein n=1 Tax=Dokdonella sp. TaxID=2291710 RepID=UPI0025C42964|nr:polysaccharide deacetylase family protein [Dokdonella sp.]MBX3693519.1 polysaccharide deacetylase family protein [Dokdonella sp.]MCW5568266.1 polysaccharide deacetylase family protein [Dokdonella sp.]